jgi:tetratricopeptide (TPR) repeat protein
LERQIRYFEMQLERNPRSRHFIALADLKRRSGRGREAIELLRGGLTRCPDSVSARWLLGECLLEAGDGAAAAAELRQVLDRDPDHRQAAASLARCDEASVPPPGEDVEEAAHPGQAPAPEPEEALEAAEEAEAESAPLPDEAPPAAESAAVPDEAPEAATADAEEVAEAPAAVFADEAESVPDPGTLSASMLPPMVVDDIDLPDRAAPPVPDSEEPGAEPRPEEEQAVPAAATPGQAAPAVPDRQAEPEAAADEIAAAAPVADEVPAMFVTRTLADIYLAQGHRDKALHILRQVLAANPDREDIVARIAELEQTREAAAEAGGDEAAGLDAAAEEANRRRFDAWADEQDREG